MAKGKKSGSKRSKSRKKGGLPAKYIKAAGGNMKKAWAMKRAASGGGKKAKTKAPRKSSRKAKTHHPKKAKSHAKKKAHHPKKAKSHRGKHRRGGQKQVIVTRTRRRNVVVKTNRPVRIVKVPGKTKIVRVAAERKHHRRKGRRRSREGYLMENPLGGMELAVGLFTGALGFGVSDFIDRYLSTHALTDKNAKDASGNELYADTPPTDGAYKGLFNGTAVLAPMDLKRWGVGVAVAGAPIVVASFVKSSAGRSALQMFGFGAALRLVGKGLTDGVRMLSQKTAIGQRLYDGEARAAALKAEAAGTTPALPSGSLPSSGLGRTLGAGNCGKCGKVGAGACCTSCAKTQAAPPPPPPPPQNLVPNPAGGPPSQLNGAPQGVAAPAAAPEPKKNKFHWGYDGSE